MGDICWSRGLFLKGCVIISVSVLKMTNLTFGNAATVPGRLLGRPKTLAFSSLSGTSKQVPSMTSIRSPFRNAPHVSSVAIGRTKHRDRNNYTAF